MLQRAQHHICAAVTPGGLVDAPTEIDAHAASTLGEGSTVVVQVVSARALKHIDLNPLGKNDPYVTLRLGRRGKMQRTSTNWNGGANCVWRETHKLKVQSTPMDTGAAPTLELKVFDDNRMTSPRLIGRLTVDVAKELGLGHSQGGGRRGRPTWHSLFSAATPPAGVQPRKHGEVCLVISLDTGAPKRQWPAPATLDPSVEMKAEREAIALASAHGLEREWRKLQMDFAEPSSGSVHVAEGRGMQALLATLQQRLEPMVPIEDTVVLKSHFGSNVLGKEKQLLI